MMVRAPRAVDLLRKYELHLARRPTTQASHFLSMMVRAPRAVDLLRK
jgi:ribosomal protein L31E